MAESSAERMEEPWTSDQDRLIFKAGTKKAAEDLFRAGEQEPSQKTEMLSVGNELKNSRKMLLASRGLAEAEFLEMGKKYDTKLSAVHGGGLNAGSREDWEIFCFLFTLSLESSGRKQEVATAAAAQQDPCCSSCYRRLPLQLIGVPITTSNFLRELARPDLFSPSKQPFKHKCSKVIVFYFSSRHSLQPER